MWATEEIDAIANLKGLRFLYYGARRRSGNGAYLDELEPVVGKNGWIQTPPNQPDTKIYAKFRCVCAKGSGAWEELTDKKSTQVGRALMTLRLGDL